MYPRRARPSVPLGNLSLLGGGGFSVMVNIWHGLWPGGSVDWSVVPVHQKVAGSVHGQGTCPGCEFNFWLGRVQEATDCCFSHLIFLSPPPL